MTERNPDIEIYIKRAETQDVLAWLNTHFTLGAVKQSGEVTRVALKYNNQSLVGIIVPGAVKGGFTSVCFEPNATPWHDDEACAIEAFDHFSVEVRCSTGGWTESDEATDEDSEKGGWYRFTENGRSVVNWFT